MSRKKRYQEEELIPVVAKFAERFTGNEHTSITYEKAQDLMGAVLYCIEEYDKYGQESGNDAVGAERALRKAGMDIAAPQAYEAGRKLVTARVEKLRLLYNRMAPEFCDYGVICLRDIFYKGIPEFLRRYDAEYCPQDTLLTLDYPVWKDIHMLSGIDAVYEYLECISWEQEILSRFGEAYAVGLLRAYNGNYEELPVNICEIVLQNVLGHLLLHKPLEDRGFGKEEYIAAEKLLRGKTKEEIAGYGESTAGHLVNQFGGNQQLLDYLKCGILNIAVRIHNGAEHHCLDKIFLM